MPRTIPQLALGLAFVAIASACGPASSPEPEPEPAIAQPAVPPPTLLETGLYADWKAKTVAPENRPFTPQYPLWTDGARKQRWIHLPPGTSIDGSDPDAWAFPIGTKLWKEFSFGARVETRYMELTESGWIYATYAWSDDGTDAVRVADRGANGREIAPGVSHRLPGESDCRACHANGPTPVLGFSALQLSSDRDPDALHREPIAAGSLDLPTLVASGQLTNVPEALLRTPPRIEARTPTERTALGYLHGNCGSCHRRGGAVDALDLVLAHSLAAPDEALHTTIDRPSAFVPAGVTKPIRIAPRDPDRSVLLHRMRSRDAATQMPPLGTRLVDDDAVRLIESWIAELAPIRS